MVTSMLDKAFETIPDRTDLLRHSDPGRAGSEGRQGLQDQARSDTTEIG